MNVVNTSVKATGIFRSFAPFGANGESGFILRKLDDSDEIGSVNRECRHRIISSLLQNSILRLGDKLSQSAYVILHLLFGAFNIPSPQSQNYCGRGKQTNTDYNTDFLNRNAFYLHTRDFFPVTPKITSILPEPSISIT